MFKQRRKTLVNIEISIWAGVKHFATLHNTSINSALETLLSNPLIKNKYMIFASNSSNTINQQISSEAQ
jgi:hypothetical protein